MGPRRMWAQASTHTAHMGTRRQTWHTWAPTGTQDTYKHRHVQTGVHGHRSAHTRTHSTWARGALSTHHTCRHVRHTGAHGHTGTHGHASTHGHTWGHGHTGTRAHGGTWSTRAHGAHGDPRAHGDTGTHKDMGTRGHTGTRGPTGTHGHMGTHGPQLSRSCTSCDARSSPQPVWPVLIW